MPKQLAANATQAPSAMDGGKKRMACSGRRMHKQVAETVVFIVWVGLQCNCLWRLACLPMVAM
jgi:hypothetical protein